MTPQSSPTKYPPNENHIKTKNVDITKFFNPLKEPVEVSKEENPPTLPLLKDENEGKSLPDHQINNSVKNVVQKSEKPKRGRPKRIPLDLGSAQDTNSTGILMESGVVVGEQTEANQRRSVRLKNKPVSQYFIPLNFEVEEYQPLAPKEKTSKPKKSTKKNPSLSQDSENSLNIEASTIIEKLETPQPPIQIVENRIDVSVENIPTSSSNLSEDFKLENGQIHPFFRKSKSKTDEDPQESVILHEATKSVHPFFMKPHQQSESTVSVDSQDDSRKDVTYSSQESNQSSELLHSLTPKELLANFYSGREAHPFLQPRISSRSSHIACKAEVPKPSQYPALYPQAHPHQHGHVRQLHPEPFIEMECNLVKRKIPIYDKTEITQQANRFFQRYRNSSADPPKCKDTSSSSTLHLSSEQLKDILESVYTETHLKSSSCSPLYQQLFHTKRTTSDVTLPWFEKYRPRKTTDILGNQFNVDYLLEWLNMLKVNPVVSKFEEEQPQPARKNGNRGRRVLSSDEEEFDPEKG
ncbi:hypothetical protein K7432_017503, partial [Basidiobolus ranarum]